MLFCYYSLGPLLHCEVGYNPSFFFLILKQFKDTGKFNYTHCSAIRSLCYSLQQWLHFFTSMFPGKNYPFGNHLNSEISVGLQFLFQLASLNNRSLLQTLLSNTFFSHRISLSVCRWQLLCSSGHSLHSSHLNFSYTSFFIFPTTLLFPGHLCHYNTAPALPPPSVTQLNLALIHLDFQLT